MLEKCYIITFLLLLFLSVQNLFGSWLAEKEKALREFQTCDFKDPGEINASVRTLAVSKQTHVLLANSSRGHTVFRFCRRLSIIYMHV